MLHLLLVIADVFSFYLSLYIAHLIRLWANNFVDVKYAKIYEHYFRYWWIPLIIVGFIAYEGLYTRRFDFWEEVRRLIGVLIFSLLILLGIITLGKYVQYISRLMLLIAWFVSLFIFPVIRYGVKRLLYILHFLQKPVIIVGAGNAGTALLKGLKREWYLGYEPIGFLDDEKGGEVEGKKILGKLSDIGDIVKKYKLDTVFFAIPTMDKARLATEIAKMQKLVKNIIIIPDLKGIAIFNVQLYNLFYEQLFLLNIKNNLSYPVNRVLKRVFDLILAIVLLPFILVVILIVGFLIIIESGTPIFFAHKRIGQNGKEIKVYKFRSMYRDAEERLKKMLEENEELRKEWETYFKLKNDPRVTKVGKFLRKTSLDELPQIFNVLKGDLSFIGPRPVVKEEIEKYYKDYATYYFMVKPGITGLWQVSGRSELDYDFRVRLDMWYVLNWSLWLDVIILFKTFRVVFKREGAY